jgi:hypothetical protein
MQIFCDESGGTDAGKDLFVVAAVAIDGGAAGRLLKSFRKATRIAGEIKGSTLGLVQRRLFFDLLAREPAAMAAVRMCSRAEALGGWAMDALHEADLYGHLLGEACCALPPLAGSVTVTPDGGRYKKALYERLVPPTVAAIAAHHGGQVSLRFVASHDLPGVQIADVVSNSVFHAHTAAGTAEQVAAMLEPLRSDGRLLVAPAQLVAVRPAWL